MSIEDVSYKDIENIELEFKDSVAEISRLRSQLSSAILYRRSIERMYRIRIRFAKDRARQQLKVFEARNELDKAKRASVIFE